MDNDHALIIKLIEGQDEKRAIQISGVQAAMDSGFDLLAKQMAAVAEQKKIQNGRVDKLEHITRANKFIDENPKMSVFIGVISYYGISEMLSLISIADVIKKYIF